jgi:antirestriction protein ArdC
VREDNRAIVRAASQASKAADWLLAFVPSTGDAGQAIATTPEATRQAA